MDRKTLILHWKCYYCYVWQIEKKQRQQLHVDIFIFTHSCVNTNRIRITTKQGESESNLNKTAQCTSNKWLEYNSRKSVNRFHEIHPLEISKHCLHVPYESCWSNSMHGQIVFALQNGPKLINLKHFNYWMFSPG